MVGLSIFTFTDTYCNMQNDDKPAIIVRQRDTLRRNSKLHDISFWVFPTNEGGVYCFRQCVRPRQTFHLNCCQIKDITSCESTTDVLL